MFDPLLDPPASYATYSPWPVLLPPPSTSPLEGTLTAICINDDWLPLVIGAIKILTRPEVWDPSDPDAALLATKRAENLLASIEATCGEVMQFRQNTVCELEMSLDGGETWTAIFNASLCIDDYIARGILQQLVQPDWTYVLDFTAGDQGFTPIISGPVTLGTYVGGSGWQSAESADHTFQQLQITKTLSPGGRFISCAYEYTCPDPLDYLQTLNFTTHALTGAAGTDVIRADSGFDLSTGNLRTILDTFQPTNPVTLHKLTFSGLGTSPF